MQFVQGTPRNQLYLIPLTLDERIPADHEVRLLDQFVEHLDLQSMGFRFPKGNQELGGRPAYHPSVLVKLYLYGYMNRIRSSRALERECGRNIELMWLLQGLVPDHNTISNFRRDNAEGVREVFRATVKTARSFKLIGGRVIAGDSTKFRAQNSRKNNFNQAKVKRHLAYIEEREAEYANIICGQAEGDFAQAVMAKRRLGRQKRRYRAILSKLQRSGELQVSTSDPDSRMMITRNNQTEVAYNVQATVDADNKLLLDYLVTNQKDDAAMGTMLERATEELQSNRFTALYDKGYHSGAELQKAEDLGVKVLVAIPDPSSQAPDPAYNLEAFDYDAKRNRYTCPQGHTLRTNGQWYNKTQRDKTVQVQHFKTNRCKQCPVKDQCTRNPNGRLIERSEYAHAVQANKSRIQANKSIYQLRQQLVEHPFGTMKRQWGFDHIMTKRFIHRASSDIGLIFSAYNLRRLINLVGKYLPRGFKGPENGSSQALVSSFAVYMALMMPIFWIFGWVGKGDGVRAQGA